MNFYEMKSQFYGWLSENVASNDWRVTAIAVLLFGALVALGFVVYEILRITGKFLKKFL